MQKFGALKKEILKVLTKSPIIYEPNHARQVLKWTLILKPDADEALQIAALSHDIERAITGITEKDLKDYSKIDSFKKEHAERSAQYVSEILKRYQYSNITIRKVKSLVKKHELGGDKESDILRDADSLAYFKYNIPLYLKRNGLTRTKNKIKFMFVRMSPVAKKIVKVFNYTDQEIKRIVNNLK